VGERGYSGETGKRIRVETAFVNLVPLRAIELSNSQLPDRVPLRTIFGKSLAVNKDVHKGAVLTYADLESKKPLGRGHRRCRIPVGARTPVDPRSDEILLLTGEDIE
jgi:hypothetical protein